MIGLLVAKLLWYIYGEFFSETSVYFIAAGTTTGTVFGALISNDRAAGINYTSDMEYFDSQVTCVTI